MIRSKRFIHANEERSISVCFAPNNMVTPRGFMPKLRQFLEKTDPLNALGCVASCLRNLRSIPDT